MKNIQDKICLRFPMEDLWKKSRVISPSIFSLVDKKTDVFINCYPVNEIIYLIKDELYEEHKD